ncbi:MAG: hypothetical protein GY884_01655 [Proteobacteria bacterium]|nr:hypothetical protein [Pseudomonadota bacterium]
MIGLLLMACTAPEPEVAVCDNPDDTRVGLMTTITVARFDGEIADGFDLDDKVGDSSNCGMGDWTSPEGVEGIDNAFARLMPALESTEAAALESILQEAINNGLVLLTYELSSYDDPVDDACVDVGIGAAEGIPVIGGDGAILSGQTYDRTDQESWVADADIVDGRVEANGFDLAIPIQILDADIVLDIAQGAIRIDLDEDGGAEGLVGGAVPIDVILDVLYEENVDDSVAEAVDSLLHLAADMDVDGDGECRDISLALEFDATSAFYFED